MTYDPTDDRYLLYSTNIDTVPADTLTAIDAVINPLLSGPGTGLPEPAIGTRYLLTESSGDWDDPYNQHAAAWSGTSGAPMVAQANDIIEWDGARWTISFDSASSPENYQYVTNITTELQYRWTGQAWVKSYQGLYKGGLWTLVL